MHVRRPGDGVVRMRGEGRGLWGDRGRTAEDEPATAHLLHEVPRCHGPDGHEAGDPDGGVEHVSAFHATELHEVAPNIKVVSVNCGQHISKGGRMYDGALTYIPQPS